MAIYAIGQNSMDGVGDLACDLVSDIADLPAYADSNRLKPGSTCLCIDTSEVYAMKSDRTWKAL